MAKARKKKRLFIISTIVAARVRLSILDLELIR